MNAHWGNILLLEFLLSHSKACDANIAIIANFGYFVKNSDVLCLLQVSLAVFATFILSSSDNYLTPQKAFVSINLINVLKLCDVFFARYIGICLSGKVMNVHKEIINKFAKNICRFKFDEKPNEYELLNLHFPDIRFIKTSRKVPN